MRDGDAGKGSEKGNLGWICVVIMHTLSADSGSAFDTLEQKETEKHRRIQAGKQEDRSKVRVGEGGVNRR